MDEATIRIETVHDTSLFLVLYIALFDWAESVNGAMLAEETRVKNKTQSALYTFPYYIAVVTQTVIIAVKTDNQSYTVAAQPDPTSA